MIILQTNQEAELIRLLSAGAIGIMPTDTVYGLVGSATNRQAVASLYAAKHRQGKPGTVIAASVAQLEELGLKASYLQKVAHLWPNALSIVLPAHAELSYLDQGKHSLAVRIPASAPIRALLEKTGPLLTTSANMPTQPPAQDLGQAIDYFGDTIDFYLDGGSLELAMPSTIIRLHESGRIETLREGAYAMPQLPPTGTTAS